jgi:hypothetical protein
MVGLTSPTVFAREFHFPTAVGLRPTVAPTDLPEAGLSSGGARALRLSAALTVTLIFALAHVLLGNPVAAIVSGAGSVVSGGGFLVLRKLKDHATEELRRAQAAVRKDCATNGTRGAPDSGPEAGVLSEDILIALTDS